MSVLIFYTLHSLFLLDCSHTVFAEDDLTDDDLPKHWGGNDYDWYDDEEAGLAEAKATGKPILLIIHKDWCGACKQAGAKFETNQYLKELAKEFVMISHPEDDGNKKYEPDGGYVPRFLFLDPKTGEVDQSIIVPQPDSKYKYYYASMDQLLQQMYMALDKVITNHHLPTKCLSLSFSHIPFLRHF